jgi:hypothetical protein
MKKLEYLLNEKDKIERRLLRSKLANVLKLYPNILCSREFKKKDRMNYVKVKAE